MFDPYRKWLGISKQDQPPNHYRLLGIDLFESDLETIENAANQRMAYVKTFQTGKHSGLSQRILNEIAAARVCLLNSGNKSAYDARLRQELAPTPASAPASAPVVAPLATPQTPPPAPQISTLPDLLEGLVPPEEPPIFSRPRRRRRPSTRTFRRHFLLAGGVAACVVLCLIIMAVTADFFGSPRESRVEEELTQRGESAPEIVSERREMTNSIGMQFVAIEAGEFLMGSPRTDDMAEPIEFPRHRVEITKPFYMGIYEVTQSEYIEVIGSNPSQFSASGEKRDLVEGITTLRHPAENMTWSDAIRFCNELSRREGLAPYYSPLGNEWKVTGDHGYRLPTEAEWEYACRAESTTRFHFGDDPAELGEYAWFSDNSEKKTHSVGEKSPNAWGLYDMYGNVWEWCWDKRGPNYYQHSPFADPQGFNGSTYEGQAVRGGSWTLWIWRSASRPFGVGRTRRASDGGFRLVLPVQQAGEPNSSAP